MDAAKTSTGEEKVWQGDPAGFTEALLRAEEMESAGDLLGAYVLRASTFYSYVKRVNPLLALWYFHQAKRWARRAYDFWIWSDEFEKASHGQLDVIGTILLRKWLWFPARPYAAGVIFEFALSYQNVPPHSRALLLMGCAEAAHLCGDLDDSFVYLEAALAESERVLAEPNWVQARHQWIRVLRRATVLKHRLGLKGSIDCYLQGKAIAESMGWEGRLDLEDLDRAWIRLQHPRRWHRLLPA